MQAWESMVEHQKAQRARARRRRESHGGEIQNRSARSKQSRCMLALHVLLISISLPRIYPLACVAGCVASIFSAKKFAAYRSIARVAA
jgi:hypothetical protein